MVIYFRAQNCSKKIKFKHEHGTSEEFGLHICWTRNIMNCQRWPTKYGSEPWLSKWHNLNWLQDRRQSLDLRDNKEKRNKKMFLRWSNSRLFLPADLSCWQICSITKTSKCIFSCFIFPCLISNWRKRNQIQVTWAAMRDLNEHMLTMCCFLQVFFFNRKLLWQHNRVSWQKSLHPYLTTHFQEV